MNHAQRTAQRTAKGFARREMLNPGEALKRAKPAGPFVVALAELGGGGYQIRVAQPAVIERGRPTKAPLIATVDTYGRSKYDVAARRFNSLVDEELV